MVRKEKTIGKKDFIKKKIKSGHIYKGYSCCAKCDYYFNANLRNWFSIKKYGPTEETK